MGVFDKLLNSIRAHQPAAVPLLRDSITKLRLCIMGRLFQKYAAHGEIDSKFLGAAVFNEAVRQNPQNKVAERFLAANRFLVTTEALKLKDDTELSEALTYL
jgi:hypothetical protein